MFKVTGVSRFKGQFKVRFANDMTRVKLLVKAGNTDIELIELDEPKDKAGCVKALMASDLYKKPEFAAAIDEAHEKYCTEKTVKVKSTTVKSTKTTAKPSLEAIKARAEAAKEAKETKTAELEPTV